MGIINFSENFECALIELCKQKNINNRNDLLFAISFDEKELEKRKSIDLLYFPYPMVKNKLLEKKDVLRILSGWRSTFPLWIDMSLDSYDEKPIVQLKCSCRFRKSKELHNQDLGFPPFRIL
ncbi:MAG: hypothetical protein HDR00_10010 [Lachnospiraceae bacterium]|nr:hypothetical protein [Lachnospiraceae bacterium]